MHLINLFLIILFYDEFRSLWLDGRSSTLPHVSINAASALPPLADFQRVRLIHVKLTMNWIIFLTKSAAVLLPRLRLSSRQLTSAHVVAWDKKSSFDWLNTVRRWRNHIVSIYICISCLLNELLLCVRMLAYDPNLMLIHLSTLTHRRVIETAILLFWLNLHSRYDPFLRTFLRTFSRTLWWIVHAGIDQPKLFVNDLSRFQ